jgi:hypothetical protein
MVAVGLVLAMIGLAACAKPPQATIDQAKAALDAAGQSEAATYAAQAWDTAQQSMNAANAEIEAQAQKFALFRSYKKANELLAIAQQDAAPPSRPIEGTACALLSSRRLPASKPAAGRRPCGARHLPGA